MRSHLTILSILILLCAAAFANPQARRGDGIPQEQKPQVQEKESQKQDEVVRLRSRLVQVPVSVSDAGGRPIRDLVASDFVIEEDGRPQQVVALGEPGKTPVELALLFDVSGSVRSQFSFEQQAAVRFIKEILKPTDSVSVFAIGSTSRMVKARTTKGDEAVTGILSIEPVKEATAFFDSVTDAALYIGKTSDSGSRHVILVISDGEENYSQRYGMDDALRELQRNDCLFYSINPTGPALALNRISIKGQNVMEAMSVQTGGKAFVPDKIEDLEAVFRQIAAELQAQYMLQYYSNDEKADAGFRKIAVRLTRRSDLRVRARQGYYLPAS
jgi:Ca-activated chloride channel homolog